jgi:cation transport ATPase
MKDAGNSAHMPHGAAAAAGKPAEQAARHEASNYSAAVSFGLPGMVFYWELATLLDIMLLGHWIEMRSVLGASRALEELARLMPSDARRLRADGSTEELGLEELRVGDRVLVRPGLLPFPGDPAGAGSPGQ